MVEEGLDFDLADKLDQGVAVDVSFFYSFDGADEAGLCVSG